MSAILGATTEQASKLTGLSTRQLRYWRETGFVRPDEFFTSGPYRYIYSFRDLVGLRTIAKLINEHHVPIGELRKVGRWFEELPKTSWENAKLWVLDRHVYFEDPRSGANHSGANPPQLALEIPMR